MKYVELKSGYNDNGPAWIGYVRTSRSGQTVYFNGRAMKQIARGRFSDVESGEVFWISGLKRNADDRHWAGSGKVLVERRAIPEYLTLLGAMRLDPAKYAEFDAIEDVDLEKFHYLENRGAGEAGDERDV